MALRAQERLQAQAGELGKAKVVRDKHGGMIHKISCTVCSDWGGRTYRSGKPNGYSDALARWTLHLACTHPEADAPCLARLDEIKAARRAGAQARRDEIAQIGAQLTERLQRVGADFAARLEAASIAEQIVQ